MEGRRVQRQKARLETAVASAQARVEQERERRFVVALAFAFVNRGRRAAAAVLAGALAFRFFLTLLPLVLVLVVGFGYLKSAGGTPADVLKQAGIKGVLASTINDSANFSDPGRTAVLLLGLVGVLSGARLCAGTLRAIHALAWGMPVVRWRRGGRAGLLFLGAVAVLFLFAGLATRARVDAGVGLSLGASVLAATVAGAIWLGASLVLPHPEGVGWRSLVPGAVLVGVGFALLQALTTNLIGPKLEHDKALYGSLGVSLVVLGWLYLIGRMMVAAPLLNAALVERREEHAEGGQAGAPGSGRVLSRRP